MRSVTSRCIWRKSPAEVGGGLCSSYRSRAPPLLAPRRCLPKTTLAERCLCIRESRLNETRSFSRPHDIAGKLRYVLIRLPACYAHAILPISPKSLGWMCRQYILHITDRVDCIENGFSANRDPWEGDLQVTAAPLEEGSKQGLISPHVKTSVALSHSNFHSLHRTMTSNYLYPPISGRSA